MYYNVLRTDNYEHEKKKQKRKGKETKHIYITHTHTHTPVYVSCIYKKLMKAEIRLNNRMLILFIFAPNKYLPLQRYTKLKKKGDKRGA